MPSATQHSTAVGRSVDRFVDRSARSDGPNRPSTKSAASQSSGTGPMPIRSRLNSSEPSRLNDVVQSLLPAGRAFAAKPQLAQRQVEIVANDQQIGQRQLVKVDRRPHALAAAVHQRVRPQQQAPARRRSWLPSTRPSNFSLRRARRHAARPTRPARRKPTLCRVFSYFLPRLPKPTISFMQRGMEPGARSME